MKIQACSHGADFKDQKQNKEGRKEGGGRDGEGGEGRGGVRGNEGEGQRREKEGHKKLVTDPRLSEGFYQVGKS